MKPVSRRSKGSSINLPVVFALLILGFNAVLFRKEATENSNDVDVIGTIAATFVGQKKELRKHLGTSDIWEQLATECVNQHGELCTMMEVGMHSARDCLKAARAGATMHCVEPSPVNFKRVMGGMKRDLRASKENKPRVNLYNAAAGGTSGGTLEFSSSGSTGDHVGTTNMWTMEETKVDSKAENTSIVHVKSIRLDDIIQRKVEPSWTSTPEASNLPFNSVFMIKIDTQGFEPTVFSGLTESLKQHKIEFILFEYWPRGMDLISGSDTKCDTVVNLFNKLLRAGYTLHATNGESHPHGETKEIRNLLKSKTERPFGDLRQNCMWFYELQERFPIDGYKMGYWSDILAVAPNANIQKPTTKVGNILRNDVLYN